mgnify:FL=1
MKLAVINGSPKGEKSVTLQHLRWWQAAGGAAELEVIHVSLEILALTRSTARLAAVLDTIRAADAVIWSTPVYHHLVPSQVFRFVEACGAEAGQAFRGKLSTILCTSIHYYDTTALDWLSAVSEDLGMTVYGSFSAGMHDLVEAKERDRFFRFMEGFTRAIEADPVLPRNWPPLRPVPQSLSVPEGSFRADLAGKRVLILADRPGEDATIASMVTRLKNAFECGTVDLQSIDGLDIKGGCLGCCACCFNNDCSWDGRDGFREFFANHVKPADVVVYAGAIRGRALSARWKEFFDRSFYNTHVPVYQGKQMAWLVSGPLGQLGYLRQIMQAYAEVGHANLAGIVTDESGDADSLGAAIDGLAWRIAEWGKSGYVSPRTFAGIGGIKIFRDAVWGGMRLIFRVDHKVFKKNGTYDYPHRHWLRRMGMALAWPVMGISGVQRLVKARMRDEMVKPARAAVQAEIRRNKHKSRSGERG